MLVWWFVGRAVCWVYALDGWVVVGELGGVIGGCWLGWCFVAGAFWQRNLALELCVKWLREDLCCSKGFE